MAGGGQPVTNKTYVTNNGSNTVTIIDGTDNSTQTVSRRDKSPGRAVNPVHQQDLCGQLWQRHLTIIDARTTVPKPSAPAAIQAP